MRVPLDSPDRSGAKGKQFISKAKLAALALVIVSAPSYAQDRLTLGNGSTCTAVTPGTTNVIVPIFLRDLPGTALGADRAATQKLQAVALQIRPSRPSLIPLGPEETIQLFITKAGATDALTAVLESNPRTPTSSGYIAVFDEKQSPVSIQDGHAQLGGQIADAVMTLPENLAEGTRIDLVFDPALTRLSNQGGTIHEMASDGTLQLRNGCVQITRGEGDALPPLPVPPPRKQYAGAAVADTIAREGAADVIIILKEPLPQTALDSERVPAIAQVQGALLAQLPASRFKLRHRLSHSAVLSGRITAEGLSTALASPSVLAVDIDPPITPSLCQAAVATRADVVHSGFYSPPIPLTGAGVRVAILDTGVDSGHALLHGHVVAVGCTRREDVTCPLTNDPVSPFPPPCSPNGTAGFAPCQPVGDAPNIGRDRVGHGTMVSGVVVAGGNCDPIEPRGLAPDAGLVVVRVMNDGGGASASDAVAGLNWIYAWLSTLRIRAVSMSFGIGQYAGACDGSVAGQAVLTALANLTPHGVAAFAASGNWGMGIAIDLPACIDSVIGVGATFDGNYTVPQPADWWSVVTDGGIPSLCQDDAAHNPNGITASSITCFSNSDALVDLVTPGVYITTTVNPLLRYRADCPGCDYGTYSGTSFASPAAEAIAALLFSARPLGGSEVEKFMKESGTWVIDPKNGLPFPRVNAMNAASIVLTQGVRGDANGDGQVTSADVFYLINNLFSGGPAPATHLRGNANCDSEIAAGDVFYLINFVYSGGLPPDLAPACGAALILDVDANGLADAFTDGILVSRWMLGVSGTALTSGAVDPNGLRKNPQDVTHYLASLGLVLDIDGNGTLDAYTDGILVIRYLLGQRGSSLISNAIGPNATRTTAEAIEAYLARLVTAG